MAFGNSSFAGGRQRTSRYVWTNWREDDGGTRRNVEQLIWAGLVALLVHLIETLQWVVELIPQAKRLSIIEYLRLVTDLH